MAKVIAVASGKGGVGKTTIVANLGVLLAGLGKKVLVVDADVAMANLTLLFNMASSPITLHDALSGESTVYDAIYDYSSNLKVLPSSLSFESYSRVDLDRLGSLLDKLRADYDYILLDCPAGVDKALVSDIAASDEVLIVVNPISPSIADALKTKTIAERIGVTVLGAVVNMSTGAKGEIPESDINKILELPVFAIIPDDPEIRQAFLMPKPKPTAVRNPNSLAVVAMKKVAARLAGVPVEAVKVEKRSFFDILKNIFKRKKK
ncbi:MAG: cell division ATPase MinD [Candidatus Diapherotrites archaeon]|nr:cell division ATPase MinD [Candidatus Diapherotrites archaeon]